MGGAGGERKLQAFDLRSGARDADRDIDIGEVVDPAGVWSDGEVIWVADLDRRIASYCLTESCVARHIPEPPGDDFPGDQTTAGRLEVGGSVTGRITPNGDVDWFAVYLDRGSYRFTLSGLETAGGTEGGPLPDPALRLLDFGGNEITDTGIVEMTLGDAGSQPVSGIGDDNSGGANNNALLEVAVKEHHYYYAVVKKGSTGTGTGAYRLTVKALDCTATTATTCEMDVGVAYGSEIGTRGDRDWIRASLSAGRTYQIDVKGASRTDGGGTLFNAGLILYDASGTAISGALNSLGGADNNARYIYRPAADATIYIEAKHAYNSRTGTYTVALADVTNRNISEPAGQDFTNNKDTTLGQALNGARVTGSIATNGDKDWFRAPLKAHRIYQIDVKGDSSTDDGGTLANAGLTLYDASGTAITGESTNTGGAGNNARRIYRPSSNRTIYIEARDDDDSDTGTYTVALTDVTNGNISEPAGQDFSDSLVMNPLGRVLVGGTVDGAIDPAGDGDRFHVILEGGVEYHIQLRGSPSSDGTLANPKLEVTHGGGGSSETNDNVSSTNKNSRIDYQVATNRGGNHAIIAKSATSNGKGTYTLTVSESRDDCSEGTGSTCRLTVGGGGAGEIEIDGDTDWFRLNVVANRIYRFDVRGDSSTDRGGTLANAGLTLYDASGTAISGASNNRGGDDDNARYIFRATADGTIFMEARDDNGAGIGTYTVALTDVTDENISEPAGQDFPNSNADTPGRILIGRTVQGNVGTAGDGDRFLVNLDHGVDYRIELKGQATNNGTLPDPRLRIVPIDGGDFEENDNHGGSANSRIDYEVASDGGGTYAIIVRSAITQDTGTYQLSVSFLDDCWGDTTTTCQVEVGGATTGDIHRNGDTDWFGASLIADRTYRIDVKGDSSTDYGGTLANAGLTLYDASGMAISGASNNAGGDDNNARYIYRADDDETIYIEARDDDGAGVGTYTVALTDVSDENIPEPVGQDFPGLNEPAIGRVLVGGSVTGATTHTRDEDMFRVDLAADTIYQIDLKGLDTGDGTLEDPQFLIYSPTSSGAVEGNDDMSTTTNNAQSIYWVGRDASGTHRIRAQSFINAPNVLGTYTLTVAKFPDDCSSGTATNCSVAVGGATAGEIEANGETDWFSASLIADRIYRIDVKGASSTDGGGTLANAGLTLYDASGTPISGASNNTGGDDDNARYIYRADDDETIYIEARDDDGSGVGTYTVALTDVTDENISEPAGQDFPGIGSTPLGRVLVGGSVTGEVDHPSENDGFGVKFTAGGTYRIDLKGSPTGDGTLEDTYLSLYSGAVQVAIGDDTYSENDELINLNALINYTVPTDGGGDYTIYAWGISPTGTYTLSVTQTSTTRDSTGDEVEPPSAPQNLTASVNEAGSVVLTWDDPKDASITGYHILRRNRDTSEIGAFTAINDDTGSAATTYVDDKVEPGTRYVYRIKAINPGGLSAQSHDVLVDTPAVEPKANSPATGAPVINGTAQVGETLTADTSGIEDEDGLSNVSYSYQWLVADGDISGATGASYALADGDEGKTVKVTVSFTDDAGQ